MEMEGAKIGGGKEGLVLKTVVLRFDLVWESLERSGKVTCQSLSGSGDPSGSNVWIR